MMGWRGDDIIHFLLVFAREGVIATKMEHDGMKVAQLDYGVIV